MRHCQLPCCFKYKRNSLEEEPCTLAHGFRGVSPWTLMLAPFLLGLSKQKYLMSEQSCVPQSPGVREGGRRLEQDVDPENGESFLPVPLGPGLKCFPTPGHVGVLERSPVEAVVLLVIRVTVQCSLPSKCSAGS